jgi:hypothetical protein
VRLKRAGVAERRNRKDREEHDEQWKEKFHVGDYSIKAGRCKTKSI